MSEIDEVKRRLEITFGRFPQSEHVLGKLAPMMNGDSRLRRLVIFGDSGVGKTRVLNRFAADHPRVEHAEFTEVPVLFVPIPPKCSVKKLAGEMLRRLGSPFWNKGDEADRTFQVLTLLSACRVRMVIFDEVNHLVDRGQATTHYFVADWIKSTSDESDCAFVLAGTTRAEKLLAVNEQLRSRFRQTVVLRPLALTSKARTAEARSVLLALQKLMAPLEVIDLTQAENATSMIFATEGRLREIKWLLIRAAEIGDAKFGGKVIRATLHQAFRELIWNGPANRNPFDQKFNGKPLTAPGEPYAKGAL